MKISSVCILASVASIEVCEELSAVATFVGFFSCSDVANEKQCITHNNEFLAALFGPASKEMLEGKLVRNGLSSRSVQHDKKVKFDSPGVWILSFACLMSKIIFPAIFFKFKLLIAVQLNPSKF